MTVNKKRRRRKIFFAALLVIAVPLIVLFAEIPVQPPAVGQFTQVDQCRIHYVTEGHGQDVVLLHGTDGSLNDFRLSPLWQQLKDRCRLTAFDRPGRALSTPGIYTIDEQIEITHQLLGQLGVHKPVLVAHSWSGILALAYALRFPTEVKGIVLLGGWVYPLENPLPAEARLVLLPAVGPLFAQIGYRTRESQIQDLLDEGFGPSQAPTNYRHDAMKRWFWSRDQIISCTAEVDEGNTYLARMSKRYKEVTVPVVALAGDADKAVPPEQSERIAAEVRDGTFISLTGQPHYIQFTRADAIAFGIKTLLDLRAKQ